MCFYGQINTCQRREIYSCRTIDKFKKNSDIDFVVDFSEIDLYDYADNYFDFKTSLEKLLKRQIDLLEDKAIKNPYLRQSIDSSKKLIYG